MAITAHMPNHALYQIVTGGVNLSTDTIKAVLLNTTFSLDIDANATYADISANEIGTAYGYTQNTKTLPASPTLVEDDTSNNASVEFDDISWTASGGEIGVFRYLAFYSDTSSDDTVLLIYDLGVNKTILDGETYTPSALKLTFSQGS